LSSAGSEPSAFRSAAVATVSTVAVFGIFAWLVVSSEQWPAVKSQFFSGEDFRASFPTVLNGFRTNMWMFAVAEIAILLVSLMLAVARTLTGPVFAPIRFGAVVFIDVVRGLPLLLVIYLLGFGLPALQLPGFPSDARFWGIVALTIGYSAYTAEVYRSGIEAVHPSQRAAARALGLGQWQALRFAVLPQAVRNVTPALLNGALSLQKDVALISVLGVREAVRQAQVYKDRTFNYTGYVVAALLFLLASLPLARLTDWYTRRDQRRRLARSA
jgi:polar amino acid transport system permease protein